MRFVFVAVGFCLLAGVQCVQYSCNELRNGVVPEDGHKVLCAVIENDGDFSAVTDYLWFTDTAANNTVNITDVAGDKSHCKSANGTWTVFRAMPSNCNKEFTIILTDQILKITPVTDTNYPSTIQAGEAQTFVSPRGGIILSNITTGPWVTTCYYSGEQSDDSRMANYSAYTSPIAYISFDPVVTVVSTGDYTIVFAMTTSEWGYDNITFSYNDKVVVTSNTYASNVQLMRPVANSVNLFPPYMSLVDVYTIIFSMGSSVTTVELRSEYADIFLKNSDPLSPAINSAYMLQVFYSSVISASQVGKGNDKFLLEFRYMVPSTMPTGPTTPPATTTQFVPPPTSPSSNSTNASLCACNFKTIWLDVVFLLDSSDDMGKPGHLQAIATIQSTLYQMTLVAQPSGYFYTRFALVSYAATAVIDRNFGDATNAEISRINGSYFGGKDVNITRAFDVAMELFASNPARDNVKQVVVLVASGYKDDTYLAVKQFKNNGGTVLAINYVQSGEEPTPGILNLASPGFTFTNQGAGFGFRDILNAFCDINCFCSKGYVQYSLSDDPRGQSNGGCYYPVSLNAVQVAAEGACQGIGGGLASIHDDAKQFFLSSLFPSKTKYLIGYSRLSGSWQWDDGVSSSYTLWNSGQPGPSDGDCAYSVITTGFNSRWFPTDCYSNDFYYTCQIQSCDSTRTCF